MYKFVVLLCVLALAQYSEAQCVNGVQTNSSYPCVCKSGYSGATCNTATTGCSALSPGAKISNMHPYPDRLPGTFGFKNNALQLGVLNPLVTGREFSSVGFMNAPSEMCSLNSMSQSVWSQTSYNSPVCRDEFLLNMPWANRATCGFTRNSAKETSQTLVYSATILITYIDRLGDVGNFGQQQARAAKTAYTVNVAFPKTLSLQYSNVTVDGPLKTNVILTGWMWNYVSSSLDLTLTSVMAWPNRLMNNTIAIASLPASISQYGIMTVDSSMCTNVAGSECIQIIRFSEVYSGNVCSFDGNHNLTAQAATCRDRDDCTQYTQAFVFKITGSSACGNVMATASVTASLISITTLSTYTSYTPTTDPFMLGGIAKFLTTLNAGSGNTVITNYTDIILTDMATNVPVALLSNGVVASAGTSVSLVIDDVNRGFQVTIDPNVFKVDPFKFKQYIVDVTLKIVWAGNEAYGRKREIEQEEGVLVAEEFLEAYETTNAEMNARAIVGVQIPTESATAPASFKNLPITNEVVAVAGAAALVAVMVVAAVVVVLKKRTVSGFSV